MGLQQKRRIGPSLWTIDYGPRYYGPQFMIQDFSSLILEYSKCTHRYIDDAQFPKMKLGFFLSTLLFVKKTETAHIM